MINDRQRPPGRLRCACWLGLFTDDDRRTMESCHPERSEESFSTAPLNSVERSFAALSMTNVDAKLADRNGLVLDEIVRSVSNARLESSNYQRSQRAKRLQDL